MIFYCVVIHGTVSAASACEAMFGICIWKFSNFDVSLCVSFRAPFLKNLSFIVFLFWFLGPCKISSYIPKRAAHFHRASQFVIWQGYN